MITPNSNSRQVYLPSGNWFDFWSGARHAGGQTITWTNSNQAQFPLFVREGAIVPMLLTEVQTLCDGNYVNNTAVKSPDSGLLFLIYPGGSSRFTVHDGTDVQCLAEPGKTIVTVTSDARLLVLQILGDEPTSITRDGIVLHKAATVGEFDAADVAWRTDTQQRLIFIKFRHGGGPTTIQF